MRVRCCANKKSQVDARHHAAIDRYLRLDEADLTIGAEYAVFGVAMRGESVFFLVSTEPEDEYPHTHHAAFFELVDARLPEGWVLCTKQNNLGAPVSLLPERWARQADFLERLVDGDTDAIAYFRALKSEYERD